MKQPIFLQPNFKERIWGGAKLNSFFNYPIPSKQTGECWGVSAHTSGESIVKEGKFSGKRLSELWKDHQELFGHRKEERFPLLTKILDAKTNLSVQVHPDNEYAHKHENGELGKTECWYVIDCEEDSELIYGHHAKTKSQFIEMINSGDWDHLLKRVKVKKGDFFYIPSGTVHAIGAGVLILETQQSSDTTYRVYDFDRVDVNGHKRKLHLDKAIDVSTIPHREIPQSPELSEYKGATIVKLTKEKYFSVYKWEIESSFSYKVCEDFLICSVIEGKGSIKTEEGTFNIKLGDHFILPYQIEEVELVGKVTIIVSHP